MRHDVKIPFGWNEYAPLTASTTTTDTESKVELRDVNGSPILTLSQRFGEPGYLLTARQPETMAALPVGRGRPPRADVPCLHVVPFEEYAGAD